MNKKQQINSNFWIICSKNSFGVQKDDQENWNIFENSKSYSSFSVNLSIRPSIVPARTSFVSSSYTIRDYKWKIILNKY